MRELQLLLTAFAVLVAGAFLGVPGVSAQNTGKCVQSCKDDCADLPKDERKSCKFSCMGGRCGIPGVIQAAQATGEPGVDCSADGECNAFCETTPDADCCEPSTTPLRANEVVGASLSLADPATPNWEASVSARGQIKVCIFGRISVASNIWIQSLFGQCEVVPPPVRVRLNPKGGPVQTAAGDSLTLVYGLIANGPLFETEVFFPELIGIKAPTLYAADDGSTYFDDAFTQLAANACEFQ